MPSTHGRCSARSRRALAFALTLAIACVLLPAAQAAAAVIDFDDLPAPGGGGQGLNVNVQYASQGVTFNDLDAFDYSKGSFAIPGFAHTPNVAVEPCFAIEFCTAPVRATFTAAQSSVSVRVGFSSPLTAPVGVRLTAFDASSTVLGSANATLPANAAATPIRTPLGIAVSSATIRRIDVTVTTSGGFTNGLAVDTLEFSTAGPPPPCTAVSAPTPVLSQPGGDLTVQNDRFRLQGSVIANGAPITSATIVATSTAGTVTGQLFPGTVGSAGGAFGPISYSGLLSPGVNDVVVSATNCRGTGTSVARRITYTPIAAGTRFRQLGQIEVTQTVQDANNATPLVAARANGFKRTFARVYLKVEGGSASVAAVAGELTAVRPDGSRPPGPLSIPSLNTIVAEAAATHASARSTLAKSLNFELPREWLGAGRLHLQIGKLLVEGAQSTLPCIACENVFGTPTPATVTFRAVPPLRIFLVSVPYRTAAGATNSPRQLDVDLLASWLRRVYPSAEVQITQASLQALNRPPTDCHNVNSRLSDFADLLPAQDPRTRFYGLVSDSGGNFMRGCAGIGGQFGSGPAGSNSRGWDFDGSYADWYGGHEIGHMYDRRHPGFCGETDDDDDYPHLKGLIGGPFFDKQGLDAGDGALTVPLQLNDWRDGWTDVMTYCDKEWMSDYTYRGILSNLCAADRANCPTASPAGRSARISAPTPPPDAAAASATRSTGGLRLSVTGSLALAKERVTLRPLHAQKGLALSQRPRSSAYAIVLRGAGGRTLARYPFTPIEESDPISRSKAKALIDEVVPFAAATKRILVAKGARTLASVRVSAHAPKVRLQSPNRGGSFRSRVTVRWRASDADGGRRTYAVLYTHDGRRYTPVAAGLRQTSLRVDAGTLPGGTRGRFRVIATDGVRTDSDDSDRPFTVQAKAPRVQIVAPRPNTETDAGQPISLIAAVSDLQELRIAGARIVWQSSLQGALGSGQAISPTLRPGTHTITLRATNVAGLTASATVTVTVRPDVPVVTATP